MNQGAVCITGMHRSGTSMVTNLLRLRGLSLGPEERLLPPDAANPDGYWEHTGFVRINDELLNAFNAAWDWPPPEAVRWDGSVAILEDLRAQAEVLIAGFQGTGPWGWKDPRASLTMPFWSSLLPGMPTVICIRNPLEVALSLRDRNAHSLILGLNLWELYNERLLQSTDPEKRIVTHFDAYFVEPEQQVQRLLDFIGLAPPRTDPVNWQEIIRPSLRHRTLHFQALVDIRLSSDLLELYATLCEEAGWGDQADTVSVRASLAHGRRDQKRTVLSQFAGESSAPSAAPLPMEPGPQPGDTDAAGDRVSVTPAFSIPSVDALLCRAEADSLRQQLSVRNAELQELSAQLAAADSKMSIEVQLRKALNRELVLLQELIWRLTPRVEIAGSTHGAIDTVAGKAANGRQPIEVELGQPVTLEGWAIDTEAGTTAAGVLIVVDGKQKFWAKYGSDRPDIADAFDQPAYARCGFRADLPGEALTPGRHTLALEVLAKDRPAYFGSFASVEAGAVVKIEIEAALLEHGPND